MDVSRIFGLEDLATVRGLLAGVWALRDGKVIGGVRCTTREGALAAAGLPETPTSPDPERW